jgi:hypothetical protein
MPRQAVAYCAGAAVFSVVVFAGAGTAEAQAPPAPPAAAEIAACLCLRQDVNVLSAEVGARQQSYNAARDELARRDADLERARASVDVNNPQSVAKFRQMLDERDRALRRGQGPLFTDLSAATARYNARVNEYNARCADQPQNPVLLSQVQATLACPRP